VVRQTLPDGRMLISSDPQELSSLALIPGFALLVAAYTESDCVAVLRSVGALVDQGCSEIACVGPRAETLHDSIDTKLEDLGAEAVMTTWHHDFLDGCEYIFFGAGAGRIAMIVVLLFAQVEPLDALAKFVATELSQ